jgi:hypothetical protein
MCLSTCKGFCNCKAQQVSSTEVFISEAAAQERLEQRRKRVQLAIMPPIFAMVPRYDASGAFKRESGWLICRQAPVKGIAEMCLYDEPSVQGLDAISSNEDYPSVVLKSLAESESSLLEDQESAEEKLKHVEEKSIEQETHNDWIEVFDPEEPVNLPVGTVVLCCRQGLIRKSYGVITSITKLGVCFVKFKNGDTEAVAREQIEVLSRPIFMFNPTTGQSYWKNKEVFTSSVIFNERSNLELPPISDQRKLGNLDEPSEMTVGFPESQSLLSSSNLPGRIFESDGLAMDFADWDNFRVVSNIRRQFNDYTEYEDPVLRIIFLANDSLIQREMAAITIQRLYRKKFSKPLPVAWTTMAFTFNTPPEVYKEQKALAGWALLRRQSKMIGYFTDAGRMEWEEYMDPESSNFFYWAEEKNLYQWNRPETLGRSQISKKNSPALTLKEEVRYKFPGEEKEELCLVTRCRVDDQTGLDCYDLVSKRNDDLTARWIPRYMIRKATISGEDIHLMQEEKSWRKTLKLQREKEIRNRHRIKAKKIAEEQERRRQLFLKEQYEEEIDGINKADANITPELPKPALDEEMEKSLKQAFQSEGLAHARSKRCKQEEQEIQDEKDKEYLAKRKVGVVSMMNELAKDVSLTRIELINLQRALTLKLTLYDKLKNREQVLQALISRRELVKERRDNLENKLREIDSKMSTPRSLMRRKILRRLHICMNRQLSGYITCEWGCNDWVRVGQEQMDHQLRGCTKRIVECTLHCSLKLSEDEWLAPHQNLENLDLELAAEFARYEPERPPVVPYQQFHEENECPKRLKPCPRKCLEWATFEELGRHLELFCVKRPAQPIVCRLGCGKIFGGLVEQLIEAEDQRLEHEQEECELRLVRCTWKNSDGSYCAAQIRCCDREKHRTMHVEQMGIQTFGIAGTYLYKVPPRIHRLKMQVWGAGGGSGHFKLRSGGAGGGGAFVEVIMHVNPHDFLEVVVGAPGQAGVYGTEVEVVETTDYVTNRKVEAADRKFEVIEAKYGTALGGTPGGGEGYGGGGNWAAGGGGGYSMVAKRTSAGTIPLVVAGGGGGGSSLHGIPGGGMNGPLPGTRIDIRNGHLGTIEAGGEAGDSGSVHNSLWPATSGEAWKGGNGKCRSLKCIGNPRIIEVVLPSRFSVWRRRWGRLLWRRRRRHGARYRWGRRRRLVLCEYGPSNRLCDHPRQ